MKQLGRLLRQSFLSRKRSIYIATRDTIEPLEIRRYLSTFQIFGVPTIEQGSVYELTLPTVLLDGKAVLGWNINWGDNSDPDGDGIVGQSISGGPPSTTHTFTATINPQSGTMFDIEATALIGGGSETAAALPVTITEGLEISGPSSANAGDPLTYTVTGPGANSAVWSVWTPSNTQYTTANGKQISFAPTPYGNWTIQVTSVYENQVYTSSLVLPVAHVAPTVTISGPVIVFEGRTAAFSSTVTELSGENDTFNYNWSITTIPDQSGNSNSVGNSGGTATLPSYDWLANLVSGDDGENLDANLTVTDSYGDQIQQTFHFEAMKDPGQSDYDHGVVPGYAVGDNTSDIGAYAVIQNPINGDIIVGGSGQYMIGGSSGTEWGAYIAAFKPDLTLDTSFGDQGFVFNAMGGLPGQYDSTPGDGSAVFAMAIDPTTGDIVATGNVAHSNQDGLVVARYNATTGQLDHGFGTDGYWTRLPPGWGTWTASGWTGGNSVANPGWTATPYTVAVLSDGSILFGGSQTQYWYYWYSSPNSNSTLEEDDFLLMKLTSRGKLDSSFGTNGYADSVNPMNVPPGQTWDDTKNLIGLPAGATSWPYADVAQDAELTVIFPQTDGSILVGGTALAWGGASNGGSPGNKQFVIADYSSTGHANKNFGPSDDGKVLSNFVSIQYSDAYLSNIEVLSNNDILAVGTAPNVHVSVTGNDGEADHNGSASCLALAWYSSDGRPDSSMMNGDYSDNDVVTTGQLITTIETGGDPEPIVPNNSVDSRNPSGAIAFDDHGNIILSTGIYSAWSNSYAFSSHGLSGWGVTRVNTNGSIDTTFGAVGDGMVAFAPPSPFSIGPASDMVTVTGTFLPPNAAGTIINTPSGIIMLGQIWFRPDNSRGFRASVFRTCAIF